MKTEANPFPHAVAITVAPNGGRRTKADHPAIPLTPAELAKTAAECREAGAAMIHVHVRTADGSHLLDAGAYREAIAAIRREVGDDLIVQITSEALGIYTPAEQRAVVREVRPEAASLALRELVPNDGEERAFADLLLWMKQEAVVPQIILYEPGEVVRLDQMRRRGLLPFESVPVLYALGRYTAGQTSTPADLLPFLTPGAPGFTNWSVCAFGRYEAACVAAAALLGGHPRVGFENNLFNPDGTIADGNAAQVASLAAVFCAVGLGLLDADGLRKAIRS